MRKPCRESENVGQPNPQIFLLKGVLCNLHFVGVFGCQESLAGILVYALPRTARGKKNARKPAKVL